MGSNLVLNLSFSDSKKSMLGKGSNVLSKFEFAFKMMKAKSKSSRSALMVRLPVRSLCSLHASLTFNKVNSWLLIKSGVKVTSGGDSGGLGDSRGGASWLRAASPLSFFISLVAPSASP